MEVIMYHNTLSHSLYNIPPIVPPSSFPSPLPVQVSCTIRTRMRAHAHVRIRAYAYTRTRIHAYAHTHTYAGMYTPILVHTPTHPHPSARLCRCRCRRPVCLGRADLLLLLLPLICWANGIAGQMKSGGIITRKKHERSLEAILGPF